jgi:hypothetical protein
MSLSKVNSNGCDDGLGNTLFCGNDVRSSHSFGYVPQQILIRAPIVVTMLRRQR